MYDTSIAGLLCSDLIPVTSQSTPSVPEVSMIRLPAGATTSSVPFAGIGHRAKRAGGIKKNVSTSTDADAFGIYSQFH
jgi:hypothetical protein